MRSHSRRQRRVPTEAESSHCAREEEEIPPGNPKYSDVNEEENLNYAESQTSEQRQREASSSRLCNNTVITQLLIICNNCTCVAAAQRGVMATIQEYLAHIHRARQGQRSKTDKSICMSDL